ncbi:MAG: ribonuclease, partial [Desulfovibrio sp.]
QEPTLASRAVRDYLTTDVAEVWCDHQETADEVIAFASLIFPRQPNLVKVHNDPGRTLWERFNLKKQLEEIYSREASLPSGGSIVFDQTEALMAVDVNSGKIGGKSNFPEMAFRTNTEAAQAVAEQLRLRDIGGQVVIDFIEMRDKNHLREVEKTMRNAMKGDRARYDVGKMSKFGLMEIVRQRLGSSAISISTEPCPCCGGTGTRRNLEWQALQAIKEIDSLLRHRRDPDKALVYETAPELAVYLLNKKRKKLLEMEAEFDAVIEVEPQAKLASE